MSAPLSPAKATHPTRADAARPGRRRAPPPADALGFTVADACRMAGFGVTKCYELINSRKLKVTRAAGRTIVTGDSLRELLRPTP